MNNEGSMGYGNTIAKAVESLRLRWEERNVVPDHSPDAGKMAALESANRELVEALEALVGSNAATSLCVHEGPDQVGRVLGTWAGDAETKARDILAKHKGAA